MQSGYVCFLSRLKSNIQTQIIFRDPIFAKLYDICQCNPLSSTAYLESLEPFILNDQLRAVPPGIVKDLFVHLEELGKYQACHMICPLYNLQRQYVVCSSYYVYLLGFGSMYSPPERGVFGHSSNNENLLDSRVIRRHHLYIQ